MCQSVVDMTVWEPEVLVKYRRPLTVWAGSEIPTEQHGLTKANL